MSKINRLPDRTWSSAASGVVQLLVHLRPGVVLTHFVNVVDPQGFLCERFSVYTVGLRRRCFRCGSPGHMGPFCKASCLAPEADSSLWSSMVYNGPVLDTAIYVGSSPSAAAVPVAPSTAAEAAACSTAALAAVPSTAAIAAVCSTAALAATPSCAVLEAVISTTATAVTPSAVAVVAAPSIAAVVASPSATVTEAPSKSAVAAVSPAAALVAVRPTAADDAALTTAPAADRQLSPSPSRSGSPSSASHMSGAEDGGSETDGFHKPCRRRKRSPQSGSPGSMFPNQKTSKKEPG